jgi:hypothetical protein
MSSDSPQANLLLERSRLNRILFGCVSFGAFSVDSQFEGRLKYYNRHVILHSPRAAASIRGEIIDHHLDLIFNTFITFVLGIISFSANENFVEMIWIDLGDAPRGLLALIKNEIAYHINVLRKYDFTSRPFSLPVLTSHLVVTSRASYANSALERVVCHTG